MNQVLGYFYAIVCAITGFLFLLLLVRAGLAVFSQKTRAYIRNHPKWHFAMLIIGIFHWVFVFNFPLVIGQVHNREVYAELHRNTLQVVSENGGWKVLSDECADWKRNAFTNDTGYWKNGEWINKAGETNSWKMLKLLKTWEVEVVENKSGSSDCIVTVYRQKWGGGLRVTRYYKLVLTSPAATEWIGATGERIIPLTNGVFEVSWNF